MRPRLGVSLIWLWWLAATLLLWGIWNLLASRNPTYSAERILWPVQIAAQKIAKDPASAPPALVEGTHHKLQGIIQRYPGSKSAAQAQFLAAGIHAARGEYPQALAAYQRVLSDYPGMTLHVISSYRAIARIHLNQKLFEKALDTYRTLLSKYPMDVRVMDVPQLMMSVSRHNAPDAGAAALRFAVEYYQDAIRQSKPGSTLYLIAQQRLAGCHVLADQWEEAAQAYESLVITYYKRTKEVIYWMRNVEELGKRRLNQPGRAHQLALEFAQRYPDRRRVVERWLKAPAAEEPQPR